MYDPLYHVKSFATIHHVVINRQMYGPLPYTHHLAAVDEILCRNGCAGDIVIRTAGWLHDVVEDCPEVSLREVEEGFGSDVAILVSAVTSEKGENRAVRNALTYPKIRDAGIKAIQLKLADRLANVSHGGPSIDMYRKEYVNFKQMLQVSPSSPNVEVMWRQLDNLMQPPH